MVSSPPSSAPTLDNSAMSGCSSATKSADSSITTISDFNGNAGAKRQLAEPEALALDELLDTFANEMDESQGDDRDNQKRKKLRLAGLKEATTYGRYLNEKKKDTAIEEETENVKEAEDDEEDRLDTLDTQDKTKKTSMLTTKSISASVSSPKDAKYMKLTDLEHHVRKLERDNLHLKQALLLEKKPTEHNIIAQDAAMLRNLGSLSSLADIRRLSALKAPGLDISENCQRLLAERTKIVTEMVEQLNAAYLSLGDASRVWHENCRIGVGVREWDACGRLQTISLWNMIRSVFTSIVVDIVELRPHLPDGEMILTKWRIQGEIASAEHLQRVCASEDCPATMRVALMAIKSSDLTFTVTTYVVFQDLLILEQHHCWDHVSVFKRLFGGKLPRTVYDMLSIDEETAAGRKPPLDV